MRTAMYREIVARDVYGNEIALYDDAQAVRDDLGLSISTIYRALRDGSLINKKSIYLDAKVIIEKTEDFVSMNEQLPNYAKRFAEAKTREERLLIRSEFCDKFRNIAEYGEKWEDVALNRIDYKSILEQRHALSNRKTCSRPVVQVDQRGKVIRRYSSVKEASKALFVDYTTALNYLSGKTKNPPITIEYGDAS